MLDISLIGTSGMMPLPNRFLSAVLLRYNGRLVLLDCGEGTQVTLKMLGWGYKTIDAICFTHFHADHISGLPGLLLAIGNAGRNEPLTIIGPRNIADIVEKLCVIASEIPFKINFIDLSQTAVLNNFFKLDNLSFSALPVDHRCPCYAYSFYLGRKGKFDVEKAEDLAIPKQYWKLLQNGERVLWEDKEYLPEMVIGGARKGIKFSFCTDTRPNDNISAFIENSDLFICEGIYGEEDKFLKAREYKHMLFRESALLAKNGLVKELWLTHYSPSLTEPRQYLDNARDVFPNTFCGYDRMTKTILFED